MRTGARMLGRQVSHDLLGIARTPVVLFFALLFPLVFFVVLAALVGNETIDFRSGVRTAQFLAPAFAAFGIAMSTFSYLSVGFAELRFTGVLKRLSGSPQPRWVLLGGRLGAGTVLALLSVIILVGAGVAFYDVQLYWSQVPAVVVIVVVAALSFSALGLAVAALAPSAQAATALANGIVIPLAFLSDLFVVAELPPFLDAFGWVFPLKHLVNALGDAFNPYVDGSAEYATHLAVIAAWGLFGAALAAWGLRRDANRAESGADTGPVPGDDRPRTGRAHDGAPRRDGQPAAVALVADQYRHANAVQWRDWSAPLFGIAFPVLLVLLLPMLFAGGDSEARLEIAQTVAASMTIYGAAVIAYVNLPQGLAEAREAGVLKRWAGTPLPTWVLLAGRALSALWLALFLFVGAYALAVAVFGVTVGSAWLSALVVLAVTVLSFSALGMAVVSVVRGTQAALAVCLGSLIVLSFISDIFIFGVDFPPWLDVISWTFPLRHAVHAFSDAMAPEASGVVLDAGHLAVIIAWGVLGVLVVLTRFNAEPRTRPTRTSARAQ